MVWLIRYRSFLRLPIQIWLLFGEQFGTVEMETNLINDSIVDRLKTLRHKKTNNKKHHHQKQTNKQTKPKQTNKTKKQKTKPIWHEFQRVYFPK